MNPHFSCGSHRPSPPDPPLLTCCFIPVPNSSRPSAHPNHPRQRSRLYFLQLFPSGPLEPIPSLIPRTTADSLLRPSLLSPMMSRILNEQGMVEHPSLLLSVNPFKLLASLPSYMSVPNTQEYILPRPLVPIVTTSTMRSVPCFQLYVLSLRRV